MKNRENARASSLSDASARAPDDKIRSSIPTLYGDAL
ncbi:MAG: hypothetical protein N838_06930 [Thiohalocapsa sp. PB-PSB1]|nr:MAG: hypothetical protein N838_06930 [Thiohalocapsa sp. PB-PSB1]